MKYTALITLAIAAITMTSTPAMARSHHNNGQPAYNCNYGNYNPYNYNPYPNGVMAPNGTWVDGTIDSHGQPAWAGGAFR
jgi:hypothetical protein